MMIRQRTRPIRRPIANRFLHVSIGFLFATCFHSHTCLAQSSNSTTNSPTNPSSNASRPASAPPLMELTMGHSKLFGLPITWNEKEVVMIDRHGSIQSLDPSAIHNHRILDIPFTAESAMQLRSKLFQEFPNGYSIDGHGDYIVIARPESIAKWNTQFAKLQRSFQQYFQTRGITLHRPDFPLVGIVFRNQAEFFGYANANKISLHPRTAGYYNVMTNRLYLYESDPSKGQHDEVMETVLHEATHQIAFNSGIHQRLSSTPLWVIEGLASIFEAPGMYEPRATLNPKQLLNPSRWETWKSMQSGGGTKYISRRSAGGPKDSLPVSGGETSTRLWESLLRDDRAFQHDPDSAYATAWAVSLYLAERDSKRYTQYLTMLSKLPAGEEYLARDRQRDFHRFFGGDSAMLMQSVDRYLHSAFD